jgi:hypothetical protein
MALVALGATAATTRRLRSYPTLITIHLFVYFSLYILFVGAICHAAGDARGLKFSSALDCGISVVPMALVVRRTFAAVRYGGDEPGR